jgi:hypothetical protein
VPAQLDAGSRLRREARADESTDQPGGSGTRLGARLRPESMAPPRPSFIPATVGDVFRAGIPWAAAVFVGGVGVV